jgi:exopolysaccharide production protein ExoY
MVDLVDFRASPSVAGGTSSVDGAPHTAHGFYPTFKRIFDVVAVLIFAPFVVPFIAILAIFVKLDGGAAFFGQPRVGINGHTFNCWKLRTMVVAAEEKLEEYLEQNPAARAEWDESQKLTNDPRITRLGRILRKISADELPQLWNVLTGDMSLVGPRPMLPSQRSLYPGNAYYGIRPGLTGLWQISDRNKCSFAGRAKFDTAYANTVSFWVDMRILLKTVRVVINGTGM